jgi:cytosine/adenosine deaminase-related metal-dependent hydrolase
LKGGATTIVEITAFGSTGLHPPREQAETFVRVAGELGARAYISHPFLDGKQYLDERSESRWHFDEGSGLRALKDAVRFSKEYEGMYEDRVRTMLFPYRFDSCSATLLKETKKTAGELNLPVHMHTSQYLPEYYESIRRYGKTPISFLHDIGFLGPKTILTHSLFTSNNPFSPAPNTALRDIRDIRYLAKTGTTVAHTPVIWARAGLILHSYAQYQKAGVNMAIGTDAFPMDMIMEMRHAALQGKVADRHRGAVTARDVFNAATLGGAKALGRDDLGCLSPGAKADIVVVDLTGIHMALTHDPIKTLVYFGSQRDIDTVIVDGKTIVEDGLVPGVDEEKLAREADELNQRWVRRMGIEYPPSFKNWEE